MVWFVRMTGLFGVLLLLMPVSTVIFGSVTEIAARGFPQPSPQSFHLLLRTIQLSGSAALLSGLIVLVAGYTLHMTRQGRALMKWLYPLMLIALFVPYPVHGLVWLRLFKSVGISFQGSGLTDFGVVWVQLMTFIPLGFMIGTLGYRSIGRELLDAATTYSPPGYRRLLAILPMAIPGVLAAVLVIFVLAAGDYGIASLFGVTVYAMHLQTLFSAGGDPGAVLLGSVPLIMMTMLCWSAAWFFTLNYRVSATEAPSDHAPPDRSITAGAGYLLALLGLLSPVAALGGVLAAPGAWGSLAVEMIRSGTCVMNSLWYSGVAGVVTVFLVRAIFSAFPIPKGGIWVQMLLTLPVAVPANITAISLLYLFRSLPFGGLWMDHAILILALVARYMPIAVLIVLLFLNQIPQNLWDAASVFGKSPYESRRVVLVPLLRKAILLGGFVVFIMAGGDTGIYILLAPPGSETISVKIYNYLHYGANDMALAMSLVYGLTFIIPFLLWIRVKHIWRRTDVDSTP